MRVKQELIADLEFAEWNPRRMPVAQMEALKLSLLTFGPVEPAVVNADGTVIGGHQRLTAALDLGWDKFPVVRVDLDETQAKALNVALNKIDGSWDEAQLLTILRDLESDTLALTGFDDTDLGALVKKLQPDAPEEFPDPEDGMTLDHQCPKCGYEWSGNGR